MTDYENTTQLDAPADAVFDYLADINNLPEYFSRMKSATPVEGGDALRTVAQGPGGVTVEGEAWFRVDYDRQRIEWGAEGESDYHGDLEVVASGTGSQVRVHISTARVQSEEVQHGVDDTVATIKQKVEAEGAAQA